MLFCLCMLPDGKLVWTEEKSRGTEAHTPKNTVMGLSSSRQSSLYFAKPKENNSCLAPLTPASTHPCLCRRSSGLPAPPVVSVTNCDV